MNTSHIIFFSPLFVQVLKAVGSGATATVYSAIDLSSGPPSLLSLALSLFLLFSSLFLLFSL